MSASRRDADDPLGQRTDPPSPHYDGMLAALRATPRHWLITGVAGFIGSHLLQSLLDHGQWVVGLDNFATGHRHNLAQVQAAVGTAAWSRFRFVEGDIRRFADCQAACDGAELELHQAALGSVPRSLVDPITTNEVNVTGFLNMLVAARDAKVQRFIYAASSSTYGDHPGLPKVEHTIGNPLSPYAVTKYVNELYAAVFSLNHGLATIGLRYFNVFGPRQDPDGAYAAVIPRWAAAILRGEPVTINGDGKTSRDFCYVANAVQANLLAATTQEPAALNQVYNVAVGDQTTLDELHAVLSAALAACQPGLKVAAPLYRAFRAGDVRHSRADITKARERLGYAPPLDVRTGMVRLATWFAAQGHADTSQ